jgi:hypothetical protein
VKRAGVMIGRVAIPRRAAGVAVLSVGMFVSGCVNSANSDAARAAGQKAAKDDAVIHQAVEPVIETGAGLGEYMQLVGKRLLDGAKAAGAPSPGDVRFYLVISPVRNVIVTGGPSVYVTSGLFQECRGEEDLAAAMAHGLAHLIDRHTQRRSVSETTDPVVLALMMTSSPMTASEEAQADRDGLRFFAFAGWNPDKFVDILVRTGNRDLSRIQDLRTQAAQLTGPGAPPRKSPSGDAKAYSDFHAYLAGRSNPTDERASVIVAAFPGCLTPLDQTAQTDARKRLTEMLPQPDLHVHHGLGASGGPAQ